MARRAITAAWSALVKESMLEQGITQKQLAEAVGVTPAVVSLMLNGKQQSSKLVEPISALLQIDLPPLDIGDPQVLRLIRAVEGLDADDVDALVAMADHYKSRK